MNIQGNKAIFWHRRDLRIADNHGLFVANSQFEEVIPVFIFDENILSKLNQDDARVAFIHENIEALAEKYRAAGNQMEVFYGNPNELIPKLAKKWNVSSVLTNKDYEPYALERDSTVEEKLKKENISFQRFKDHVIFEEREVVKDDGLPYTVFTPFMNKWKKHLALNPIQNFDSEGTIMTRNFKETKLIPLESMGFVKNEHVEFPEKKIAKTIIKNYHETRDIPSILGTTRLSVHLRFGTLSIRMLAKVAQATNEKYFNELIWRDFYAVILFHFPETVNHAFKKQYDFIPWEQNMHHFQAWCDGKTGYPIVDAGMRELNQTGFMHNRVRMIVASFLCKHLLLDWRLGERYFAEKLLDFDLASNIGGWQWASSSGCDAVPYFRIFNPSSQQLKFDPKFEYVKKWVPEFGTDNYPEPIVEHSFARNRALSRYKENLN